MGRKKKINENRTAFAKRIEKLQLLKGYSSEYVLNNLLDDEGTPLINDQQTLSNYKSGKRKPKDFDKALKAFATFYDVTTDYLLGLDDTPNPQIKSVQDFTGLSDDAVKGLVVLKNTQPDVLAMMDALLTSATSEHITLLFNLYQQIYDDYQDIKEGRNDSAYDMMKMQIRFLLTQRFYEHLKCVVIDKLASHFDEMIEIEDSISPFTPDDSSNE